MSDDFGSELKNLASIYLRGVLIPPEARADDVDASDAFLRLISDAHDAINTTHAPRGLIVEIPPGHYALFAHGTGPEGLLYDIPANVQLYVCPGALIRPAEGVTLVIRGSLFAGPYQIFGYDRAQESDLAPKGRTAPKGRIVFAGKLVPAVLPEWWGAVISPDSAIAYDSSSALRAAINAACVTRDYPEPGSTSPHSRPSLPVLLGGRYWSYHTLTVNVDSVYGTSERHLILRGRAGLGTPNVGIPSITRLRREDEEDGCLLRLGPNTSFEIEDVNFTINNDSITTDTVPPRNVDMRVEGCVDVDGRGDAGSPRRGLFRHCTIVGGARYAVRVQALDDGPPRHIEIVDCCVAPYSPTRLSLYGLEVTAGVSTMIHVEGAVLGALTVSGDPSFYPTLASLPDNATIYLQGGSVLLQASGFQGGSGPRPSRGNEVDADSIELSRPDGQDVFLAPRPGAKGSSTHFTARQIECQSWWFFSRPQAGDDQVVLLNVAQEADNSGEPGNKVRFDNQTDPPSEKPPPDNSVSEPPAVIWLGTGGQCVFLGCRFGHSVLTDDDAYQQITDVGTVFERFVKTAASSLSEGGPFWDPRLLPGGPGTLADHQAAQSLDPGGRFRPASNVKSVPRPPSYQYQSIAFDLTYDDRIPHVVPLLRSLDPSLRR